MEIKINNKRIQGKSLGFGSIEFSEENLHLLSDLKNMLIPKVKYKDEYFEGYLMNCSIRDDLTLSYESKQRFKKKKEKKRDTLDFTDKELYHIMLAFSSYLSDRDTWISKGGARVINNAIGKITENAMKRKNFKSILSPLIDFDEEIKTLL